MEAEFLRSDIHADVRDNLRTIVTALRDLHILPDANDQNRQALEAIQNVLGEPIDQHQTDIEQFTFVIPAHTFQQLITDLGAVTPQINRHYMERHGVLYRNTHPPS